MSMDRWKCDSNGVMERGRKDGQKEGRKERNLNS